MRANVCRHFKGLMNDRCDAGIDYEAVKDDAAITMKFKYPCFNACLTCKSRSFPTQAEIDAFEADVAERLMRIIVARAAITEDGKQSGTIACPNCGGRLKYSIAQSNGHAAASCSTKGCVSFIQ